MSMLPVDIDALDRADMERLAAGHGAALNDLMERHATRVFQFLCRMLGNEDDANDLAQETFSRVYRSCGSFQTDKKFSTWLYAIAANLARNHFRWRLRHPEIPFETEADSGQASGGAIPSPVASPADQALAAERMEAVRMAVRQLSDELREAIVLCEWEDRSVAEAAEILHATPKAVESRLYRARQALREQLKSWL